MADPKPSAPGTIEVITGCMFSAKTSELILRLEEEKAVGRTVCAFKSMLDGRYHATRIATHDGKQFPAVAAPTTWVMRQFMVPDAEVVGIDEAHFFQDAIVDFVWELKWSGKTVIVACLDMDYTGHPFGPSGALLAIADHISKKHAKCAKCGGRATMSLRKNPSSKQILVGGPSVYEARCAGCWAEGLQEWPIGPVVGKS